MCYNAVVMNRTYKEWFAEGRHVIKGQKATGRNDAGEPTFHREQTAANKSYPRDWYNDQSQGYEYEGSWEEMIGDPEWYH